MRVQIPLLSINEILNTKKVLIQDFTNHVNYNKFKLIFKINIRPFKAHENRFEVS